MYLIIFYERRENVKIHKTKWYKNWSLRKKLLTIISFLMFFSIMTVSILSYIRYSNYFTEQIKQQTQQIIEQAGINVDSYLNELFQLNLSVYYNDDIIEALENKPETDQQSLEKQRKIENFLGSIMILPRQDILRVYILTENDVYSNIKTPYDMDNYSNYKNTNWYKQAFSTQNQIFIPVHSEKVYGRQKTEIFSFARSIRSKNDSSKVIGVIKTDASYFGIKNICDKINLKPGSGLFIIDEDKNVIYKNSNSLSDEICKKIYPLALSIKSSEFKTIDNEKYLINAYPLNMANWKIVAANSYPKLNEYFMQTRNAAFLMALNCSIFTIVILAILINGFLKPLFHIVKLMQKVQYGNLNVKFNFQNNDEIAYLGNSFNSMISTIKEMIEKNARLAKEVYEISYLQKEAQYNALCSQIKPHFLYNTLNTISLLIKCNEQKEAVENIEKLSFLLRGIMNIDKIIPLETELKIVDSYLGLQKSRHREKLSYSVNIPENFLCYQIPALSIQPIVENAVIHGCEQKSRDCLIKIYCTIQNDLFLIHIEDNGKGIESNQLDKIIHLLEANREEDSEKNNLTEKIGLLNVNSRIKLIFGEKYGLSLFSEINFGTHVIIRLPLCLNKE